MKRFIILFLTAVLALMLSSCGLKGDLYLPDKSTTPVVINQPAQNSSSSSSTSSQP
jgi:predicted small lipoprotein YifL